MIDAAIAQELAGRREVRADGGVGEPLTDAEVVTMVDAACAANLEL
jgi:hypothetical protein